MTSFIKSIFTKAPKARQNILSAIIHFLCIAIIIFLPEVVMNIGDTTQDNLPPEVFARCVLFIVVYYINYFFIVDKCLNGKHTAWKFLCYNVILFFLSIVLLYIVWKYNVSSRPMHEFIPPHPMAGSITISEDSVIQSESIRYFARTLSLFIRDGLMLILAMFLSLAIKLSKKWVKDKEIEQMQITTQREEELKNLKNQLNPHFLFNTLNSIYALIDICPKKAQKSVHELSYMLRYILYETPSDVELKSELNFVQNYIDLMKMRLGDNIIVNTILNAGNCEKLKIAPLIFITIVENVFKHGNTGNPLHEMTISITAQDNIILCETFNHYNPNGLSHSNGIGLNNLKRRLNLIYGDKTTLLITKTDDTFSVKLIIDLNK